MGSHSYARPDVPARGPRAACQLCGHQGHLGADLYAESHRPRTGAAIVCRDAGACWRRYDQHHGLSYPIVAVAS